MRETGNLLSSASLVAWGERYAEEKREGGSVVPLDRRDILWLVAQGSVELYALPGSVPGRRRFLWSGGAGALLPAAPRSAGSELLAAASENARLLALPIAQLRDCAARTGVAGALAAAVEDLVLAAGTALSNGSHPAFDRLVSPGDRLRLARGRRVGVGERVAWIAVAGGRAALGDDEILAVTPALGILPVARGLWLTGVSEESELAAGATPELLKGLGGWAGISALTSLLLARADAAARSEELAERRRIESRSDAERRMAEDGLARLAGVLAKPRAGPRAEPGTDPLLAACRAIGAVSGVSFAAPPRWEREGRVREPLAAICRASRVRHRRVALRGTWWRSDCGPLLAYDAASGAPRALLPEGPKRYRVFDPATGTALPADAETAASLAPFAESFYKPAPETPIAGVDLLRLALPNLRSDVSMTLAMALGSGLLGLIVPVATGWLFSDIIPSSRPNDLWLLFAGLAGAALGTVLFDVTRAFALVRIEGKWSASLQASVVDRLLALPVPFFRRFTVGDLALRAGAVSAVRQILGGAAVAAVLSGVFSVLYLAQMFFYSGALAVVAVGILLVAAAVNAGFGVAAMRVERERQRDSGRIAGLVLQMIQGIAKLRVAGAERRAFAVWCGRYERQKRLALSAGRLQNGIRVFNDVLPILSAAAVFAVAGRSGAISPGRFLAFQAAFGAFLAAGIALSNTLVDLLNVFPALERARPILDAVPEATASRPDPGALSGRVSVDRVSFRYRLDGPLVLENVSLAAEPGEFIAIVGPSGSGKSTLLRLLLGFEEPESGSVSYDDQDLSSIDVTAVRSQIGVVLQSSRLRSGDVFTNIVGAAPLTIDDAWEAAEMAGLGDTIRELPMGMHTVITEGGATFSGGQRQRLLIARALVRRPRLVLFDEATSALDNRTQDMVRRSLEKLNATRIVIAHRLSTIRRADRIYLLDAGRVVQSGDFEHLEAEPGLFARLVARQLA